MLAVHEEKLRRVDTSQEDLYSMLENRRQESRRFKKITF